jgi:hypothetical protein
MKHCVDLQALLTDKQTGEADIGLQMMEQLDALSVLVKTNASPLEVLQFIIKYDFAVALHILLTLPMSVVSGEIKTTRGPLCHKNDCLGLQR